MKYDWGSSTMSSFISSPAWICSDCRGQQYERWHALVHGCMLYLSLALQRPNWGNDVPKEKQFFLCPKGEHIELNNCRASEHTQPHAKNDLGEAFLGLTGMWLNHNATPQDSRGVIIQPVDPPAHQIFLIQFCFWKRLWIFVLWQFSIRRTLSIMPFS